MNRRDFMTAGLASVLLSVVSARAETRGARLVLPPPAREIPPAWKNAETLPLWPQEPPGKAGFTPSDHWKDRPASFLNNIGAPSLHVFHPAQPNGQGVLVIPGGGYTIVSIANEGVEVAEQLNALGYTVFVLTYRLPGEGWLNRADVPLQDAQRAMRLIRAKAGEFAIRADQLSVIGFSAGGHLAGSLATAYGQDCYEPVDTADTLSARPFGAALIYPVVTMKKPYTHDGSRRQLLGDNPPHALVARRSVELNLGKQSPPFFLLHAMDDTAVPVENSLGLMRALRKINHPVEAHLLEEGGHGFGVGHPETPSARWVALFDLWLQRQRIKHNASSPST